MSTTNIQLLRSSIEKKRPAPSVLLDGQVALNLNFKEPGLFFRLTNGQLAKVGPVAYSFDGLAPNTAPVGFAGNSVGEEWLDDRITFDNAILKLWDGVRWTTSSGFTVDNATGNFSLDRDLEVNRVTCEELLLGSEFRLSHDLTANGDCQINIGTFSERFNAGWFCTLDVKTNIFFGATVSGPAGIFTEEVVTADLTSSGNTIIGSELADTLVVNASSSFEAPVSIKEGLTAYGDIYLGDPLQSCVKELIVQNRPTFHCETLFKETVTFEKPVLFKDTVTFDKTPAIPSLNNLLLTGNTVIGDGCNTSTLLIKADATVECPIIFKDNVTVHQSIVPNLDSVIDLGTASRRFQNIYTGDLHLKNERGDWTMIEEETYLSLRNNKTGKTFRLTMEEV